MKKILHESDVILRIIVLAFVGLLLLGCSEKTEEEKLAKFESSLRYKTYRLTSEKVAEGVVTTYNKAAADDVDVNEIHAILGILWFIKGKSRCCYIEADILENIGPEDCRNLVHALKTLALFGMDLPELSKSQYEKLKTVIANESDKTPDEIELEHKLYLICLTLVGIKQGDPGIAKSAAEALGATSQVDYLKPLVGAIVEVKRGNKIEAVRQLYKLSKSERLSEHGRIIMQEVYDDIRESKDKEGLAEEITKKIIRRLGERMLNDIFTEENLKGLLDNVKQLPEKITGKQNSEDKKETSQDY